MTRQEKMTTVLSVIAILISIATPFVTYFWLDPTLQAMKHRGRLQVSTELFEYEKAGGSDGTGERPVKRYGTEVRILNVGEMPVKDMQIVVHGDPSNIKKATFTFEPIVQYDLIAKTDDIFITVKRPLPPKDTLKFIYKGNSSLISVSNEYGETSIIEQLELVEYDDFIHSKKPDNSLDRTRK